MSAIKNGAATKDREASEATVKQAKATLEQRRSGVAPADIAVLRAKAQVARTALESAKTARKTAIIEGPYGGRVVAVSGSLGDSVQTATTVVVFADVSHLYVETSDLDESEAVLLKVGMPVKVELNAYGARAIDGKVDEIALLGTPTGSGDTNYTVRVSLDDPGDELRLGMSVRVNFLVATPSES